MRISNLKRKEEEGSIYREKGILSMGCVAAAKCFLCMLARMAVFVDISHQGGVEALSRHILMLQTIYGQFY